MVFFSFPCQRIARVAGKVGRIGVGVIEGRAATVFMPSGPSMLAMSRHRLPAVIRDIVWLL